ncbi:hypothetical protein [Hymenobacter swuensis]|nr:hypothetical protein [Hymenobacter swuensis]
MNTLVKATYTGKQSGIYTPGTVYTLRLEGRSSMIKISTVEMDDKATADDFAKLENRIQRSNQGAKEYENITDFLGDWDEIKVLKQV